MEAMVRADHPWVRKWMEARWQRDLGITAADVRLMRKDAEEYEDDDRAKDEDDAEEYEDDDRTDAEMEEDDDRKKKVKADDDQDDADEAEARDRMNDMYVMRGYRIR